MIVPTYNRAELLKGTLDSVQALTLPGGWKAEILVVDNNSSDRTCEVAQDSDRQGPLRVRRVVETKQGLNHARNRGAKDAAFDHLVFLDDDVIVDEKWLEAYANVGAQLRADCVVGPVEPWFEVDPPEWMTSSVIRSVSSSYSRRGTQTILLPPEQAHEIPGCNFGVLKSAVVEAGGFHPELDRSGRSMLAGGDFEFGEKLVLLGKRVVYSPDCRVRHFISREKISAGGLRARWEGLGATTRALMQLRADCLSLRERFRLLLRMGRFCIWSLWSRLRGDKGRGLEWELQARRIFGLLFKGPRNLSLRGPLPRVHGP